MTRRQAPASGAKVHSGDDFIVGVGGAGSMGMTPAGVAPTPAGIGLLLPSVVALIGYLVAAWPEARRPSAWWRLLSIGWLAHGLSILIDIAGIGTAQGGIRFGFAPALSVTVWLVIAVYEIESRWVTIQGGWRPLAAFGAAVVVLAWLFPGQLYPQVASPWAPAHWLLGIASYGLFGVAVLHAMLLRRAERRLRAGARPVSAEPAAGIPVLRLERLTFAFVWAGFVALTAAIAIGYASADTWRWDHKSVFSLLGWVVFAGLLAGRQAFGWRGRRAAGWLYAGAVLLLLAYVGSRFVIEVVLARGRIG